MSANVNRPSVMPAGVAICDLDSKGLPPASVQTATSPTSGDVLPLSTCLNLRSTYPLVLPRINAAGIAALDNATSTVDDGMICYNTTTGLVTAREGGTWHSLFSNIHHDTVELNQADMLAISGGVELIPSPGAGFINVILQCVALNKFAVAAFANGAACDIVYDGTVTSAISTTFTQAFINQNQISMFNVMGKEGSTNIGALDDKPIIITSVADFTGGNVASQIVLDIWYMTIAI